MAKPTRTKQGGGGSRAAVRKSSAKAAAPAAASGGRKSGSAKKKMAKKKTVKKKAAAVEQIAGMRALTVRQPWAYAIMAGAKDIENRTWAPKLKPGERIVIHAGAAVPYLTDAEVVAERTGTTPDELWPHMICGACLGTVRFDGTVTTSDSPWFSGPIGWRLSDPKPLRKPIPRKGALGLWRV